MPECALISWVLAAMPADAQVNSRGICHLPQQQVHKEQLHFWPGEQKLRSAGFPSDCSFYFSLPSGSPPLGGVARPRCPLRQHLRFSTCKARVWRGSRALHSNSCRLKHYLQEQWCWLSRMGAPFDPGEAALNVTAHCPRMREEHQWCYCAQQPPITMFRWRGMT